MEFALHNLRKAREILVQLVDKTPVELYQQIPAGFRNSIAWNAHHMVVVQQRAMYAFHGLQMHIPADWGEFYGRDCVPSANDPLAPNALFLELVDQTERDWKSGLWDSVQFEPRTIGPNMLVRNMDEMAHFVNFHEGMHIGYIMAQRKALGLF